VTDDEVLAGLAARFDRFVELELRYSSARYTILGEAIVANPGLARVLLAAPDQQRRPNLFFAAVQYLLRTNATGHPLAGYLPTLGGDRAPDAGLVPALVDLVTSYPDELAELCATRRTQTNEPRRSAMLLPGFGRAADLVEGRPLALLELGTSAGLLLLPDRYAYRYRSSDGHRVSRHGRQDAPEPLVLDCEVRGDDWPWWLDLPPVADRVGVDVNPLDPADEDTVTWLRSLIWPEHTERLDRLDAALAEARTVKPRLVQGDMVDALPAVLSTVDDVPCVFASSAVNYLTGIDRRRLAQSLAAIGRERDLVVVLNEVAAGGVQLFARQAPAPSVPLAVGTLAVIAWLEGRATVEVLAVTQPHGSWLRWQWREYAYSPAA
jgi:hypothetical protein